MKSGRAAGKYKFRVEMLKYGGKKLRKQVFEVTKQMWEKASIADEGQEAAGWPKEWKI